MSTTSEHDLEMEHDLPDSTVRATWRSAATRRGLGDDWPRNMSTNTLLLSSAPLIRATGTPNLAPSRRLMAAVAARVKGAVQNR